MTAWQVEERVGPRRWATVTMTFIAKTADEAKATAADLLEVDAEDVRVRRQGP